MPMKCHDIPGELSALNIIEILIDQSSDRMAKNGILPAPPIHKLVCFVIHPNCIFK
jgi:hypothetical protein